jgi:hypothetical protein
MEAVTQTEAQMEAVTRTEADGGGNGAAEADGGGDLDGGGDPDGGTDGGGNNDGGGDMDGDASVEGGRRDAGPVDRTGPSRGATGAQACRRLLQLAASYPHRLLLLTRLLSAYFGSRASRPNLWLW